jgi:hypothetical protein
MFVDQPVNRCASLCPKGEAPVSSTGATSPFPTAAFEACRLTEHQIKEYVVNCILRLIVRHT